MHGEVLLEDGFTQLSTFLHHQISVLLQQGSIDQVFLVLLLIEDRRREMLFEEIVQHRWREIPQETSKSIKGWYSHSTQVGSNCCSFY